MHQNGVTVLFTIRRRRVAHLVAVVAVWIANDEQSARGGASTRRAATSKLKEISLRAPAKRTRAERVS